MEFSFYPNHDAGCGHPDYCPHAGNAAIYTLISLASENSEYLASLHRVIDAERQAISKLLGELEEFKSQLAQAKLELKIERQNKFATREQLAGPEEDAETGKEGGNGPSKRGAPIGHPGWFRPTPTHYDWDVDVDAPSRCPHCGSGTVILDTDPIDHLQEDIIDGQYRVVLYRHVTAKCLECDRLVQKSGAGEILGSRIGPGLRSKAVYLRNVIGISYRKVPRAIEEMFGISFIHFQFTTSRAGYLSRDVLGPDFTGTLVTDCYSGYHAHVAGAKQKRLAHLARTARDWQKLTEPESVDFQFFEDVKTFVKRACKFHRIRKEKRLSKQKQAPEIAWLTTELERLTLTEVSHEKAITLQGRILRHLSEWLVFVDAPRVPPTNNLAERALRPLVVLRKLTYGSRSLESAERIADLMTVAETARRHGHRASAIYYGLFTRPPDRVLRTLYASR